MSPPRLLLVDDNADLRRSFARTYRGRFDIVEAEDGQAALGQLTDDQSFDAILCDLVMPNMDGPQLYDEIERRWPQLCERFIVLTGNEVPLSDRPRFERESVLVVRKPFEPRKLGRLIELVLER